jgi:hypothetical protein
VLGLRGAGLPSRILSWLVLLCLLAAAAGADVLHATGRVLRHTVGATTAAALPWALVFIAFVLLIALLRHARLRRHDSAALPQAPVAVDERAAVADQPAATPPAPWLPVRPPRPRDSASIVPGFSARLVSSAAAGAAAGVAAAAAEQPGLAPEARDHDPGDADTTLADHLAESDDAGPGDAGPDETEPADAGIAPADPPAEPADAGAEADDQHAADTDADTMPADPGGAETFPATDEGDDPATGEPAATDQGADDDAADNMPVFHRMWSTPAPPDR